jgi:hypothetical protein
MQNTLDIVKSLLDPEADHAALIEQAWNSDADEFFMGLDLALNPNLNFGLTKVPAIDEEDDGSGNLTFAEFYNLAMRLAHNDLMGELAKQAVIDAALRSNVTEWNMWYRRILLKTLHKFLPMEIIQQTLIRLTTE